MNNLTYLDDYASFEDMLASRNIEKVEPETVEPEVIVKKRSIKFGQDSTVSITVKEKSIAERICKHCPSVEPCLADRYYGKMDSYRIFYNTNFVISYLEKHFTVKYA